MYMSYKDGLVIYRNKYVSCSVCVFSAIWIQHFIFSNCTVHKFFFLKFHVADFRAMCRDCAILIVPRASGR